MSRSEQQIGKGGENAARLALLASGVLMVEKIGTPVRLLPAGRHGIFKVIFGERVSGDHRGIMPDGRSVLAETKTILERNLAWSDLREHQPDKLQEHADYHGLSLLVWVHMTGVYIMEWPVPGFGPRKSITIEFASNYDEITRLMLLEYSSKK